MTIKTNVIDKVAFFTTFGGKLVAIYGHYPENVFEIRVNRLLAFYEAIGGFVPYRRFCNQRRSLKRKARKFNGLPAHFSGNKNSGFKFEDLMKIIKPKK